ncbi:MAG: hypothetical protein H8D23_02390 [Candidatus Brocadiales bacterium]|nr:hypothetical protein [Candidatus Brocadiales bacterium]
MKSEKIKTKERKRKVRNRYVEAEGLPPPGVRVPVKRNKAGSYDGQHEDEMDSACEQLIGYIKGNVESEY